MSKSFLIRMYDIILAFITAFSLTFLAIPSIISIAKKKKLYDVPGERSAHTEVTPSLGGIAIFAGTIFSIILWTPFTYFGDLQYILCSFIIIFLIGAKDDIDPIAPAKKLGGQIFAAAILVLRAKVGINSFYGILGIYELPYWSSVLFSIFVIVLIINAFNLIDGINGLSASAGSLIALTFGIWFYATDHIEYAVVAAALVGSSIAFLKYNFTPAQIFMGDTGSLLLGLVCAILAIEFIELNDKDTNDWIFMSGPAAAIGVLILPLFDTLQVFTKRILKGKSPFQPDKTHLHHLLLNLGLTHTKATVLLIFINLMFILLVYYFDFLGNLRLILLTLTIGLILSSILHYLNRSKIQSEKI